MNVSSATAGRARDPAARRKALRVAIVALWAASRASMARGQAPTFPVHVEAPGTTSSTLGAAPGSGANPFGLSPGGGEMILGGRPGPAFPRVPTAITIPSGTTAAPPPRVIAPPPKLPIARVPLYGSLAIPETPEEEGPPDGLILDDAIARLVRDNLDLRTKSFEIPQAQADLLSAGLRANPILYADGQLVPYGQYAKNRPGGPTQYDLNVSHPFDLSGKRQARTHVAVQARRVLEAQYQDAVRLQINNLYTAFVDVLAARETVRYAEASVKGLDTVLQVTQRLYERSTTTRPDVSRVRILREAAEVGSGNAHEALRRSKRTLAALLNIPPAEAESLELRGTIADVAPPPPPADELIRIALTVRPDLVAQRLGIRRAEADVRLARAQRFADVYVLYQPYTFQDNAPIGLKSPSSWALGATVPLPIHNRNQGGIQRAELNVAQTQVELAALERRVVAEVAQAEREYALTRAVVQRMERDLLPAARQFRDDTFTLYVRGDLDALANLNAQRDYNEAVRQYRDAAVRHRRSMLALNTAVGQRILP
ncbi:MAG: TolC family protein [Planctomycetaceae bacterium]|nr:TolC family protein [Planctomycetaceae bacterium]MBV8380962.1 TolC family protein [Planctomycetaceae bacterium]